MAKKKAKKGPPESAGRGRTGRFVPCPAMHWRHPEDRVAFEVRWSSRLKKGVRIVSYFYSCSSCTPNAQVFLNDWTDKSGFTIPQAEAEGLKPKCTSERKAELLAELGLMVAPPPPGPPGPHPPLPPGWRPPPSYAPAPKSRRRKPQR